MAEITRNNTGNRSVIGPESSLEAHLLAEVLAELRAVRLVLERLEHQAAEGAREFLPAVRSMLGRKTVKAAASASRMFGNGGSRI